MIQLFSSEYMLHPVGLEMSQNACGHNCFYCFATLKDSKRKFDSVKFANQINNLQKSETFLAKKIKDGYPVVFSNNTDPFAKNNIRLTKEILPAFIENKIPLFFQTKTGEGMFDVIKDVPQSTFYISITGLNDNISKEVERQAPVVSERVEAIEELQKRGHHVIIGINPLAEEWLPEDKFEELVGTLTSKGVKCMPLGVLYFTNNNLPKIEKHKKGGVIGEYYLKGNLKGFNYAKKMTLLHYKRGLVVPNMPLYSSGINHFLHKDQKKILTVFDFVNHIIDTHGANTVDIKFEDYFNFFNKCSFLEDGYKMDNYLFTMATKLWYGKKENRNILTKEHFYNILWNATKIAQSLDMNRLFSFSHKEKDAVYRYHGGKHVDRAGNYVTI